MLVKKRTWTEILKYTEHLHKYTSRIVLNYTKRLCNDLMSYFLR